MRPLDDIVRTMPPDAVELRAVRFQVRPTAGESAGDWLSDAILGSESSPADGPRPLSIRELHWLTATGGTVLIRLDQRERVEPDDLARLMGAARRRGLRFAIWSQGGTDLRPQMVLTEVWFTGHPPPPDPSAGRVRARVEETVTPTGTTVTIEERIGRQPLWLLMLPLLVLSFAWVFFLVLGALPKMVRDIWQRGARGVRRWCARRMRS